jgi:hypothetical protein
VKVWAVRKRDTKTPSYGVRWSVAGNVFSDSFRTKALADHYRARLMRAMRDGEEFDKESGLPDSMEQKKSTVLWYDFALRYLAMKWPHAAPNYARRHQRIAHQRDCGAPRRAGWTTVRPGHPQSAPQLGIRAAGARRPRRPGRCTERPSLGVQGIAATRRSR